MQTTETNVPQSAVPEHADTAKFARFMQAPADPDGTFFEPLQRWSQYWHCDPNVSALRTVGTFSWAALETVPDRPMQAYEGCVARVRWLRGF